MSMPLPCKGYGNTFVDERKKKESFKILVDDWSTIDNFFQS